MPRPWDPDDATKLLTAITFAGLGGFWTLFYSYWARDKGSGMAHYMGRLTGPITGKAEAIPAYGFTPGHDEGLAHVGRWRRYLFWEISICIGGNLLTTLMTCLLAYALLFPKGLLPQGYELAVVQSRFFEVSWGVLGRFLFLIIAAAFLSDTWLATVDAVSRIHTDCLFAFFPKSQSISVRTWYLIFLFLLSAITSAATFACRWVCVSLKVCRAGSIRRITSEHSAADRFECRSRLRRLRRLLFSRSARSS